MSTVILAEKPSVARAYAELFNFNRRHNGFIEVKDDRFPDINKITWAVGHLVELKTPDEYDEQLKRWSLNTLPLPLPKNLEKKVKKEVKEQFEIVKQVIIDSDCVIIGTDAGREGESIARSIFEFISMEDKVIKRLWLNQTTNESIIAGLKQLKSDEDTKRLYNEALTREAADYLTGMNLTRLVTALINDKQVYNVGRILCPTLGIVVRNDLAIENFQSVALHELVGTAEAEGGVFKVQQSKDGRVCGTTEEKTDLLQEVLSSGLKLDKTINGTVRKIIEEEKQSDPPTLLNLTKIQQKANNLYKYSAKKTLKILQGLYEKKFVTYARTECCYIGEETYQDLQNVKELMRDSLGYDFTLTEKAPKGKYVNDEKIEEHSAITPTKVIPTFSQLSDDEQKIYRLIALSVLKLFCPVYEYSKTTIVIQPDRSSLEFSATGKTDKVLGWKVLEALEGTGKVTKKEELDPLPIVAENEPVSLKLTIRDSKTNPPKPLTEARLLFHMENPNAGDSEEIEILKETNGIGTAATRADTIDRLKSSNYIEIRANKIYSTIKGRKLFEVLQATMLMDASTTAKWELYLKKIEKGTGTKEEFLKQINQFILKMVETLPSLIERKKQNEFLAIDQMGVVGNCPKCNGEIRKIEYTRKSDKKKIAFYGCSGKSDGCDFSLNTKFSGKSLTLKNVQDLLGKGVTTKIKGFKSTKNSGKTYDAKIKLVDYKMVPSFD